MSGVPEPGQVVRVRCRQYLVEEVVPPPKPSDQHLVRLSCLDDDAQGQRLEALWEKEVDARIVSDESWRSVGAKGFDEPELFSAWLDTLRWNCVTSSSRWWPRSCCCAYRCARAEERGHPIARPQRRARPPVTLRGPFSHLAASNTRRRTVRPRSFATA